MILFLNGQYLDETEARISAIDRGLWYGDGVFETLRAYEGRFFKLRNHMQRLSRGLQTLQIEADINDIPNVLENLLRMNHLSDAYARVTITRGVCEQGLLPTGCGNPTVLVYVSNLRRIPRRLYREGVDIHISKRRNTRSAEDSEIKSISFLPNLLARMETPEGFYDSLLLNHSGYITECTTSNIFFIKDGRLHTPSLESGILKGITRQTVIELADRRGIQVEEGLYTVADLLQAEEVFITNTIIEILPVRTVAGKTFSVGEITGLLMDAYRGLRGS